MTLRKIAALVAALAMSLTLFGAGISAQFTDSATATTTIHVGTFNIDVSSPDAQVVVDGTSVTYTVPTIQGSAAGSAPFHFTITNTGSMAANITVTASAVSAPFSNLLAPVAPYSLAAGAHTDFVGGIGWSELGNAQLGSTVTITYTISATA